MGFFKEAGAQLETRLYIILQHYRWIYVRKDTEPIIFFIQSYLGDTKLYEMTTFRTIMTTLPQSLISSNIWAALGSGSMSWFWHRSKVKMQVSREKVTKNKSSLIDIYWLNCILSCLTIEMDPKSLLLLKCNLISRQAFLCKEPIHLIKTSSLLPSQVGPFKNSGSLKNIHSG